MTVHSTIARRSLGVAAAAAVTVGTALAGSAAAAPPTPSASAAGDTLTVTGTGAADDLVLRLASGDPTTLQVVVDGAVVESFSRATFSRIDVLLLGGADRFQVDQSNGAFADEAITVDAGNGDDTVLGGDANEMVLGGNGDDTVDGNRGADRAMLGNGEDTFIWDGGDGSDVVDGGRGPDTLVFNGAAGDETMRLSPNGTAAVFLRSPGSVRMDMVDVEALRVAALGGVDTITVDDMTGTTLRDVDLDLSVLGAADQKTDALTINGTEAADDVTVQATGARVDVEGLSVATRISGTDQSDKLHVSTLGGDDSVAVDPDAQALMDITVDLGDDEV